MVFSGPDPDESTLAARMKEILTEARWDPADPAGAVLALGRASAEILCLDDGNDSRLLMILESAPLATAYAFAAATAKVIDQRSPAQRPERRAMTAEEFLEDLRQRLLHIADLQASALAGLGDYRS